MAGRTDMTQLEQIEDHVSTGRALGDNRFMVAAQRIIGRVPAKKKPGTKK